MIELTITFDPATGAVNAQGPLHDKVCCLGLLELAKVIVMQAKPPEIVPANGFVPKLAPFQR